MQFHRVMGRRSTPDWLRDSPPRCKGIVVAPAEAKAIACVFLNIQVMLTRNPGILL